MKIEKVSDEKIVVALSEEDLNELDITYDEMDYSNIETRRVIWTILDEACKTLGEPLSTDGRLLIEVSPEEDGGCKMYFSAIAAGEYTSPKKLIIKKDAEPILFFTDDSDSFLDAFLMLKSSDGKIKEAEPFIIDGNYCIIIYPELTKSPYLAFCLGDYGKVKIGEKNELSRIYEYGKSLGEII